MRQHLVKEMKAHQKPGGNSRRRPRQGRAGIAVGDELIVLTWLHLARRDVLEVHPRDDLNRPLTGVFATRSAHRPNPVGLHRVSVLEVAEQKWRITPMEAVDGRSVVDIKPVLAGSDPSDLMWAVQPMVLACWGQRRRGCFFPRRGDVRPHTAILHIRRIARMRVGRRVASTERVARRARNAHTSRDQTQCNAANVPHCSSKRAPPKHRNGPLCGPLCV
jgi:hypothetical protein